MSGRVAWITVAPVKGLALASRDAVMLEREGVRENRRFHLIDDDGNLINGKRLGRLALARAAWDEQANTLALELPGSETASGEIALGEQVETNFYGRPVQGRVLVGPWSESLSRWAGRSLRLVQPEPGAAVDRGEYGAVTLLSSAALDDLARAAGVDGPIDARRFRMLFGIDGIDAHEEDSWVGRRVRVGEALVEVQRLTGRCAVTKVNPATGESDVDTLDAIQAYRSEVPTIEPIPFGVAASVVRPGSVRVGDEVAPDG